MSDFKNRTINKKKKFVADGVFRAELHEFLSKVLIEYGYAGCSVKSAIAQTKIKVRIAGSTDKEKGAVSPQLKAEIESLIQKRFGYAKDTLTITLDTIHQRALCAAAQAENVKAKLLEELTVRFCAQSVITNVIRAGEAKGCEVVISGKLRQQRAKAQKYKEGYLVTTGEPARTFVDTAIRHVFFKQGMIGIKVKIMLPYVGEVSRGGRGGDRPNNDLPQRPPPDKIIFREETKKFDDQDFFGPAPRKGETAQPAAE